MYTTWCMSKYATLQKKKKKVNFMLELPLWMHFIVRFVVVVLPVLYKGSSMTAHFGSFETYFDIYPQRCPDSVTKIVQFQWSTLCAVCYLGNSMSSLSSNDSFSHVPVRRILTIWSKLRRVLLCFPPTCPFQTLPTGTETKATAWCQPAQYHKCTSWSCKELFTKSYSQCLCNIDSQRTRSSSMDVSEINCS